jgi:hypothetical protein
VLAIKIESYRFSEPIRGEESYGNQKKGQPVTFRAPMKPYRHGTLIALQCFVVLFVALHNWIPLGSLNDVKAVRSIFPPGKPLGHHINKPHSGCDRTRLQCLLLWKGLSGLALLVPGITYGLACYSTGDPLNQGAVDGGRLFNG